MPSVELDERARTLFEQAEQLLSNLKTAKPIIYLTTEKKARRDNWGAPRHSDQAIDQALAEALIRPDVKTVQACLTIINVLSRVIDEDGVIRINQDQPEAPYQICAVYDAEQETISVRPFVWQGKEVNFQAIINCMNNDLTIRMVLPDSRHLKAEYRLPPK